MPTGYTADVQEGKITKFSDFALLCARAFGALIDLRDDRLDAPLPKIIKADTSYRDKALAEAEKKLRKLREMTAADARIEAQKAHAIQMKSHKEYQAEQDLRRSRYEAMLAQVKEWTPPSKDHQGLKAFMQEQLSESIRFDCGGGLPVPKPMFGPEWLAREIASAERDVTYHTDERNKEIERAESRNEWLQKLRQSLA